jgi:NAD(P)-dependent dehydrogenase (short-subunit alcohol dehydrogenase family)
MSFVSYWADVIMSPKPQTLAKMALAGLGGYLVWRAATARRLFDLRQRVALVTGGSRGLGLVIARQLVEAGAIVVICARDGPEISRAVSDLSGRGGQVVGRVTDLTFATHAQELVQEVVDRYGRLDIIFNNAGVIQVGPFESMTLDDFHEAMANNFWSAVYVIRAAAPIMKQMGGGRIVNIASIGGKIGVPHLMPYCASKFALVGLSQALRAELAKDGIIVTTVCPGLMRTGSHGQGLFKGNHRAEYAWFSISGSIPFVTIGAERAAAQIIRACRRGDAEIILTPLARFAALANQVTPSLTAAVLAAANRFLLPRGEDETPAFKGFESHSAAAPSILTRLNEKAEKANNEEPVAVR